jgi:hypothetical protein
MTRYSVLLVALVLVILAVGAWAYPDLQGATGLVTLPTAGVAPVDTINFALDYQKMSDDVKIYPARLNGGVTDRLELSAVYAKADGDVFGFVPINNFWEVGTKYAFMTEPKNKFALAVGGAYGNVDVDYFDNVTVSKLYAVISKNLGKALGDKKTIDLKAHAGLIWAKVDDPMDVTLTRPFVGLEVCGKNKSSLALEYRWKDSNLEPKALFSAALRYPLGTGLNQPLWLEAGTTNGGLMGYGSQDSKLFVGVAYSFSAAEKKVPASGKRTKSWGY